MNVASIENCKTLFELSRWEDTSLAYADPADPSLTDRGHAIAGGIAYVPAYDLGYLLRKLPTYIYSDQYEQKAWLWLRKNTKDYNAWYWVNDPEYGEDITSEHGVTADTPEDAATKLAIELFKQNILSKM